MSLLCLDNVTTPTYPPGHAAMEAAAGNLIEAGDKVLVTRAGTWGDRFGEMARRIGVLLSCLYLRVLQCRVTCNPMVYTLPSIFTSVRFISNKVEVPSGSSIYL